MMLRKISLLVFTILLSFGSFAQEELSNFKYVLVPKQYEFQKKEDSYQLNSLHKFLFEKAGYQTLFSTDVFPEDLKRERCLALSSKVISNPSMFSTRLTVELYDCYNRLVYSSKEAASREKDYKKAYHETLRAAMEELVEMGHEYKPNSTIEKVATPKKEEVAKATTVIAATEIQPAEKTAEKVVEAAKEEVVKEAGEVAKVAVPAAAVVAEKEVKEETPEVAESESYSIEGSYQIDMWGICKVVKKGDNYSVIGGDEDFEFATISPTSNPTMFMIKKTGFKQVQLLQLDEKGNIKIDSADGFKTYKRVN